MGIILFMSPSPPVSPLTLCLKPHANLDPFLNRLNKSVPQSSPFHPTERHFYHTLHMAQRFGGGRHPGHSAPSEPTVIAHKDQIEQDGY